MPNNRSGSLSGLYILVTRPAHQADSLCDMIEKRGGKVLRFPVIEIRTVRGESDLSEKFGHLDRYQMIVFVSANAVAGAAQLIGAGALPEHLVVAAIGARTAEAVRRQGWPVTVLPKHAWNSEALLQTPEMRHVESKRVLIVRGSGGRELLGKTLSRRGAAVDYAEVYRRVIPRTARELKPDRKQLQKVGIIVITSNEGLQNLVAILNGPARAELFTLPLAVISKRTAILAEEMGFRETVVAGEASDTGLVEAIDLWWQNQAVGKNGGG